MTIYWLLNLNLLHFDKRFFSLQSFTNNTVFLPYNDASWYGIILQWLPRDGRNLLLSITWKQQMEKKRKMVLQSPGILGRILEKRPTFKNNKVKCHIKFMTKQILSDNVLHIHVHIIMWIIIHFRQQRNNNLQAAGHLQ